jgi:hypothetical protein
LSRKTCLGFTRSQLHGIAKARDDGEDEAAPFRMAESYVLVQEFGYDCRTPTTM